MRRIMLTLAAVAASVLLLPGTTIGQKTPKAKLFPVTVVDDHHNRVRITHQPKRIVTLFPGQTEILFAIGLEKRVVGDASYEGAKVSRNFRPSEWPSAWGRDYPVRSKRLPHIGGGCCGTPYNIEAIEGLHTDLVIGPYSKGDVATYKQLRDLGIKVIVLDPANVRGILRDITLVGKATGARKQASVVVGQMRRQEHSDLKRLGRKPSRPRVYYEIDASNPTQPITAGPGTFIDEVLHLAGGRNVADGVTSCHGTLCYPAFSLEELVKLDPKVILLGDSAYGTTVASVKSRPGWGSIAAIKSGKIYPFDDDLVSRAGPRIMIGLDKVERRVHPEAFRRHG